MSSSWDSWEGVRKIIWRSKFLLCARECQKLSHPVCTDCCRQQYQKICNTGEICQGCVVRAWHCLSPLQTPWGGCCLRGGEQVPPGLATGPLKARCSTGVRVLLRGGFCLLGLVWLLEIRVRLNVNASAEAKAESQQTKLFGDTLLGRERPLHRSDPNQHLLRSNAAVQ